MDRGAALFDAILSASWKAEAGNEEPPAPGGPRAGLTVIGRRYVALLTRPGMADLFRIVIAELPRFPEPAESRFRRGKTPCFDSVRHYLEAEQDTGTLTVDDPEPAATQFLGMISNCAFRPRTLVADWAPDATAVGRVVDEAVLMMTARYGTV
ncbi:hypothetical protein GCM10010363_73840 [Streptomyces omiyaensis]|uniref:TetR/AcrR family transcriptional regulator C-terminal domain-containing protein n=1 Tax=Streptomyces omiyaensis TaxID=68247 RepID=UPI00198BF881|nr:TetR/AcrR family transcriptional regulator C-terminal domain-containing protein [Streptomyces omiyaensis]GGY82354.1 hypothetical protein GCM10010363_73840 [Streptomyces omiyaensis]